MHSQVENGLWTAAQVAEFLRCSTSYVYKAAVRDVLPCVRIGRMLRFDQQAVRAFAVGQRATG